MKKLISMCLIFTILLSNFAYGYENTSNQSLKDELIKGKIYNINGREITVKLDMEKIKNSNNADLLMKQIDRLNSKSMDNIEKSVNEFANSLDNKNSKKDVKEIILRGPIDSQKTITAKQETYKLVKFPKGFALEYLACSKMDVTIYTDNFTSKREIVSVNNYRFYDEGMSSNGDLENITINCKISSDKKKVTMTTNYTAKFGFDIPIFDFGIPITYTTDLVEIFNYTV